MATVNEKMTAIADNIRSKTGKTEPLTLDTMASGINEVYEAGKKVQDATFWNEFQRNGQRTNYSYAFRYWASQYIRPLNKIIIRNPVQYMCCDCKNLKELEPEYFDFSGLVPNYSDASNGDVYALYTRCTSLEIARDIGIPPCSYGWTYAYCSNLHTIEIMRVNENSKFDSCFAGASKLQNVTFEGVIGRSIAFSFSPLSVESMKSIITHLKNYAGTANAGKYTLTLKDSCKTLMAEQGAIEEFDNKTYDQYITDIGWNLA